MGNKSAKENKEFQSVTPYVPSSKANQKNRKKSKTQPRRPTVAPALLLKESSGGVIVDEEAVENKHIIKRLPLKFRSPSLDEGAWTPTPSFLDTNFDFNSTEGQNRRTLIASCEAECSLVLPFLFVGGFSVANSKDMLKKHNITRIINCALCAVDNVFESDTSTTYTYLSLNMLDGRQDDVSWFLCEVINFIELARMEKCNVLLHCEKGISRSCSFAIAYVMWATGCEWKVAFDYVKERRPCSSPNTGFTCNLIEIDELFKGESRNRPLMFRLAEHLPHDSSTAVLKIIRDADSRNIISPHFAFFNSDGIFIIRPSAGHFRTLYIWKGRNVSEETLSIGCKLGEIMLGIFSDAENIEIIEEGAESQEFKNNVQPNLTHNVIEYDDLFSASTSSDCSTEDINIERRLFSANQTSVTSYLDYIDVQSKEIKIPSRLHVDGMLRGKFLYGIEEFKKDCKVILSQVNPQTQPDSSQHQHQHQLHQQEEVIKKQGSAKQLNNTALVSTSHSPEVRVSDKESQVSGVTLTSEKINNDKLLDERRNSNQVTVDLSTNLLSSVSPIKRIVLSEEEYELNVPATPRGGVDDETPDTKTTTFSTTTTDNNNTFIREVGKKKRSILRTKPVLFQCFASPEGPLVWQYMGIYDDDDLAEDSLFLLLCPQAPHFLWKGATCMLSELSTVNSVSEFKEAEDDDGVISGSIVSEKKVQRDNIQDTEITDECQKIIKFAMKNVELGEVPLSSSQLQALLSSGETIRVDMQGNESDDWWDAFNRGM